MSNISITRAAMTAETKLRNIRKAAAKAQLETALRWADKESVYLAALPAEVRGVLVAAGLIEPPTLREAWVDVEPEPETMTEAMS